VAKQMRSSCPSRVPEDEHGASGAVRVACSPPRPSTHALLDFTIRLVLMLAVLRGAPREIVHGAEGAGLAASLALRLPLRAPSAP
jgi:hypothetical protein